MKVDLINAIATPIAFAIVLKRRSFAGIRRFPRRLSSSVATRLSKREALESKTVLSEKSSLKRRVLSDEAGGQS